MRRFFILVVPLVLQLIAYVVVFVAVSGHGSFVGLLAMPAAAVTIPLLVIFGFAGARGKRSVSDLTFLQLLFALVPPILLLIMNALVT